MALIFHRLVQKDLRTALRYYEEESGTALADRFFAELDALVAGIERHPKKFHLVSQGLRRANMTRFPTTSSFAKAPEASVCLFCDTTGVTPALARPGSKVPSSLSPRRYKPA